MTASELQRLKQYFDLKSLHVSSYWLECCLEWFKEQHEQYTEQYMYDTILQQWLETDLRDIEVRSLPPNLTKEKERVITGNYAVQLMYVKDISRSSLSQLKKIRDMYKLTRSHNEDETEPPDTGTGKRVLYLHLTDGVQFIFAFEYHQIQTLNLNMTPGIKLLLIGPLLVRNGEILLKGNNVKILGGEVSDLLVTNSVENVLARELKLEENPNPGQMIVETQSCDKNSQTKQQSQPVASSTPARLTVNVERHTDNTERCQESSAPAQSTDTTRPPINSNTNRPTTSRPPINSNTNQPTTSQPPINSNTNRPTTSRPPVNTGLLTSYFDRLTDTTKPPTNTSNNTAHVDSSLMIDSDDEAMMMEHFNSNFDPEISLTSYHTKKSTLDEINRFFDDAQQVSSSTTTRPTSDTIADDELLNIDIDNIAKPNEKLTKLLSQEPGFDFDIDDELDLIEEVPDEEIIVPIIETPEPFVYISQLLESRDKITTQKYRVKASFTRVIEKVSVNQTRGWYMKFEIKDSTGKIVVDFSSEIIEEMMGLSPEEAIEEKRNVKTKKSPRFQKMTEAISRCKQKLQAIDGMMDLQFKENCECPTIVDIESVKRKHLDAFKSRVDSAKMDFT